MAVLCSPFLHKPTPLLSTHHHRRRRRHRRHRRHVFSPSSLEFSLLPKTLKPLNVIPPDLLREECGVVGIHGDPDAASLCYLALHALQHRGQKGAGIVTSHGGDLHSITGLGLVSDFFDQPSLDNLPGHSAIGHVRYSTSGGGSASSALKNVQPFLAGFRFGSVAVAHNGNFVNYGFLCRNLEEKGSFFNTTSDTEVIIHLIAQSKSEKTLGDD